jgi:SAM-dependent methyltransferase
MSDPLADVARYYSRKLAEHGPTSRGVDWNGEAGQIQRFDQLAKVIDTSAKFSVNDLGCGYGAFFDYLTARGEAFSYTGTDVSDDMLAACRARLAGFPNARFFLGSAPSSSCDFGVASGIFNVRLACPDAEWERYIGATLDSLNTTSRRGFAFNCLTSYSDPDRKRANLYYADPGALFDLCVRKYSRHVALLHDYGLYEFTILVRK